MNKPLLLVLAGLSGCLLLLPIVPIDARTYMLQVMIFLFLNIVLAQSYDMVGGQMGYINLGHITFFAVGAYTFGILFNAEMGAVLSLALSVVAAVVFAALISVPFFRLRGPYFSLATFGLVKLMEYLTINLGWLTGGSNGLKIEPGDRTVAVYYLSLALVFAVVGASWLIVRSRLGLAMKSIREDEEVARDFGVPVSLVKVQALLISSIFPGFMGGLYTWHINFIDTGQVYGLAIALTPIAMAMLGGSGLIAGPVIGAVFLYGAEEVIWTNLPFLKSAILGLVIVLVGLFMPGGLARLALVERVLDRLGLAGDDR